MPIRRRKLLIFLIVSLAAFSLSIYTWYWSLGFSGSYQRIDKLEISDVNIAKSGGVLTINFTVYSRGIGSPTIESIAVEWNSTQNNERMFFKYSTSIVLDEGKNAAFSLDFPAGMFHSNQTVLIDVFTSASARRFYTPPWNKRVLIP